MEATNKPSQANDYAVARALNDLVNEIIILVYGGNGVGLIKDNDIAELNRAYILITRELEIIYSRNAELQSLKPEPIWKHFDVIKGSAEAILDYINESDDHGYGHNLRVEKLCIIAGVEKPEYTTNQQGLVKSTNAATADYVKRVKQAWESQKGSAKPLQYGWEVFEYSLTYKPDGTILVNQVLKLKKVHAGSITEKLLEQAINNPNKKFKPDLGKTSRNISTIISSAGFTPVLRDLFFPTVNGDTVVFRPYVTKLQADLERIDRTELDLQLYEGGALCRVVFEPK